MVAVSVNLLRLPTSLTAQITGRPSSLKLVSAAWGKYSAAFSVSPIRTFRFRVSCAARPATVEKVCDIVRKQLAIPAESELTPESKFSALGADSLDTVEIVMELEEAFGIAVEEDSSQNITTVQEAADLIEKLLENKTSA